MITRLYISNFALIREMEVYFPGKLTVITGETGAGKSIFLEALGLVLGKKAEQSLSESRKCVVEAEFRLKNRDMGEFFDQHGLEHDDRLVLRREISAEGRSRCLVNDSVVPLQAMKELSTLLVDVHSQHQTLFLNQGKFQLELVDGFAGNEALLVKYREEFSRLNAAKKELAVLESQEMQARKEQDYLQFLFTELKESGIEKGRMAALEEEGRLLENLEAVRTSLVSGFELLGSGDTNVLQAMAQTKQYLSAASKYGKQYQELLDRATSLYIELKDLSSELERQGLSLELDEKRLDEVNGLLDRQGRLMKKHGAASEEELIATRDELEKKLLAFASLDDRIRAAKKAVAESLARTASLAAELSSKRSKCIPAIEKEIRTMLGELAMPAATFRIEIRDLEEPGAAGSDAVSFLFSANKGIIPQELQKVASGGELSRLMLCLKALLAERKQLPTIIFDEIDTGVSGEVAARIGTILHKMSGDMQVIAITHLPQMASRGDHHLFVYKEEAGQKTVSRIRSLDPDERILEIAKMLSAGDPGNSALENARELLRN